MGRFKITFAKDGIAMIKPKPREDRPSSSAYAGKSGFTMLSAMVVIMPPKRSTATCILADAAECCDPVVRDGVCNEGDDAAGLGGGVGDDAKRETAVWAPRA